jgi:hypothetical protein
VFSLRTLLARPRPALCGIPDGFVLQLRSAQPTDLACRDLVTRHVAVQCGGCGPRLLAVCDHHEQVIVKDPAVTCQVCAAVGDPHRLTFLHSTSSENGHAP